MKRYFPFILILFLVSAGCSNSPTSPNGSGQWVEATSKAFSSGGRYGLAGTVFNNAMWAIGGAANTGTSSSPVTTYYPEVWSSANGATWSEANGNAPFGGRYGSQVLSYNGSLWLIGGNKNGVFQNDVWSSPDGVNWTNVLANTITPGPNQFTPREDFGAVVFNPGTGLAMWVIGGFDGTDRNDVWSSTDGINWTKVVAKAPFAGRWGLSTTAYNNEIWVFGGATSTTADSDPTQAYGDAWFSANGNAWTEATSYGGYGLLYFTQVVPNSNNNLLWLTAGFLWNNWGSQDVVSTSANGSQWSGGVSNFPQRFYHLSLAYNNSVWVIGGCDDFCNTPSGCPVTYLNDVWHNP